MSGFSDAKRRLREQSEHYLLQDSVRRLGKGVPGHRRALPRHRRPAVAAALRAALPSRAVDVKRRAMDSLADDGQGLDAAAARARRAVAAAGAPVSSRSDVAPASLPEIERKVSGLGAKVAAERAERGWSLAQLAQRAGMSPGAVHKIEKSGMTPTIASLMKIAAALGRSVSYFVEEPATPDVSVVRHDERAPVYTSKHGLDLQNISGRYGPFLIAGAEAVMAPYADSGPTPMNHPGEELVIVTDGRDAVHGRRPALRRSRPATRSTSARCSRTPGPTPPTRPARAIWLVVRSS